MEQTRWLIWSNEHRGWWKPNHSGYTLYKDLAGIYTFEQACKIVRGANQFINWDVVGDTKAVEPNESMIPYEKL